MPTSILDVLTNAIGAVLILVVIFIKLMGEDTRPTTALAATLEGTAPCPRVYVSVKPVGALNRNLNVKLVATWPGTPDTWEWNTAVETADQALQRLPSPNMGRAFAMLDRNSLTLLAPVTGQMDWSFQVEPYDGEIDAGNVAIRTFVSGARLDEPNTGPNDLERRFDAVWLDEANAGTKSALLSPASFQVTHYTHAALPRVLISIPSPPTGCL